MTHGSHEWVVIVLRVGPCGFREFVAILLRLWPALSRLVVNLGHDVCEGRVRRYNTSPHQGRQRMEGVRGNMVRGGGAKGKRVGLLWSGNWHVCQEAVETVLSGGALRPLPGILTGVVAPNCDESSDRFSAAAYAVHNMARNQSRSFAKENNNEAMSDHHVNLCLARGKGGRDKRGRDAVSFYTGGESETISFESSGGDKKRLLNLFV